ncbi:hypothetical protein [Pontixanthobacter aquaemixtae]|nr:hypothetical protein [Pontixanthobacter aquaemixtae]
MYRHFALVTIALTAAIALFADGEKREAVAGGVETAKEYVQDVDLEPKLVVRNSNAGAASPGLDTFYSGGGGQDIIGNGFASSTPAASRRLSKLSKSVSDAELAKLGLTREQFLALSDQEKEAVLTKLNNGENPVVTESVVQNSTAASLRRSGRSGQSADY